MFGINRKYFFSCPVAIVEKAKENVNFELQ